MVENFQEKGETMTTSFRVQQMAQAAAKLAQQTLAVQLREKAPAFPIIEKDCAEFLDFNKVKIFNLFSALTTDTFLNAALRQAITDALILFTSQQTIDNFLKVKA